MSHTDLLAALEESITKARSDRRQRCEYGFDNRIGHVHVMEAHSGACVNHCPHPDHYPQPTPGGAAWGSKPDRNAAIIAHLPIGELIADDDDRSTWPDWAYVPVELAVGRRLGDALAALRTDTAYKDAFGEPVDPLTIAAPVAYPAVERPATDTGTHGSAPVSVANLDELRAYVADWSPDDRRRLRDELEDRDATDPEIVADAISTIEYFNDVVTEPDPRPAPVVPPAVAASPDEGIVVAADIADQLEADYKALNPAARSWIAAIAKDARPSVSMKEHPTARRYGIVAGLVLLSDGLDNDDAVRACIAEAIGNELAHSMALSVGALVGSMNHTEADTFRDACYSLAKDGRGMAFTPGPVLSPREAA